MKKFKVAIIGATGAVGQEMLRCLYEFDFPFSSIKLLASKKSKGKKIVYDRDIYYVEQLDENSFDNIDVAFFSAGGSISKKYVPIATKKGCICIDNTSYFRMDEHVPLVVPEVNGEQLKNHKGIISNPNCTTIQMVSALKGIDEIYDIERIVVSTYQAVSGAGVKAMKELYEQSDAVLNNRTINTSILPVYSESNHYQIAFNCIPQVDVFENNHFTKEEMKMVNETKKIFDKNIDVNATCVRVPVLRGHSESIYIETKKDIDINKVFDILKSSKGIDVYDDITNQRYPMPTIFIGDELVHVGRIRKDLNKKNALSMWVVADQLMKGAAYNAVDIALTMIEMDLI